LWGGTVYKISWVSNTFENHVGSHFTLVKNGNDTYTLTMASGTVYEFDTSGKLTQIEDIDENSIDFTYESGTLTTITDTIGRTVSLSYSSGRLCTYASLFGLTRTTYPDSEYEEYAYDDIGNVASHTDCNGNETTYTYDSIYRMTQIEYQDQSTVSLTYDLNSNRTRMDDDALSQGDYVSYSYDAWNRMTSETRYLSQSSYAVSYQYDVANRLTTLTYPDDMEILYSYDDLNRTTEVKRYVDGSNDEVIMDNTQYDTESLLTQFDYGNDLQATFSYDSRDRVSAIDVKNGATSYLDLDYAYDNNSNITQLVNGWRDTSSSWHSDTESYSYDGLDRLTSASCNSWSHSYSYDKAGNRAGKDSVTYTINVVNEVTALSDGTSFTYDDNGNRTQKAKGNDTWDYTYDYANRLTAVEENSETIGEYAYDGYGRRIQATENNVTTTYVYSGLDVVYEATSTGTACYIYGPTGRLAKRTTVDEESSIFYYSGDHLGSTRLATDESGNIVVAITYHPFGEVSIQEGTEHYTFTGKELDETGLYYYGARYYDPDLGRFITRDSIKGYISTPQSLNRFAYCQNNPLKYVDPWGEHGAQHDIGNPGEEYTQKTLSESSGDSSDESSSDEGSDPDDSNDSSSDQKSEEERMLELLAMIALAEGLIDTKPAGGTHDSLQDAATSTLTQAIEDAMDDQEGLKEDDEYHLRVICDTVLTALSIYTNYVAYAIHYAAADTAAVVFGYAVGFVLGPLIAFGVSKARGYSNGESAFIAGCSLVAAVAVTVLFGAISLGFAAPAGAAIGSLIGSAIGSWIVDRRRG
jgi:RHS repeat-associated protein